MYDQKYIYFIRSFKPYLVGPTAITSTEASPSITVHAVKSSSTEDAYLSLLAEGVCPGNSLQEGQSRIARIEDMLIAAPSPYLKEHSFSLFFLYLFLDLSRLFSMTLVD